MLIPIELITVFARIFFEVIANFSVAGFSSSASLNSLSPFTFMKRKSMVFVSNALSRHKSYDPVSSIFGISRMCLWISFALLQKSKVSNE